MRGFSKGFSLIELLIVLAILALVLAGTYNLFSYMFASWNFVEEETFVLQEAKIKLEELGREIRNAKPLKNETYGVKKGNDSKTLYLGPDGLGQIRYQINKDNWLYRGVANEEGRFLAADNEKILLLAGKDSGFKVEENLGIVEIEWVVLLKDGRKKRLKGVFATRNGFPEGEKQND